MKKPHNLINWSELSRLLTTGRDSIRPKRIPEKHREKIEDLIQVIHQWKARWSDELKKRLNMKNIEELVGEVLEVGEGYEGYNLELSCEVNGKKAIANISVEALDVTSFDWLLNKKEREFFNLRQKMLSDLEVRITMYNEKPEDQVADVKIEGFNKFKAKLIFISMASLLSHNAEEVNFICVLKK